MKNRYAFAAVFHPEADGGYSVRFPQLDGCFTQGDDFEDAAAMAQDALMLYLYTLEQDGAAIPEANLDGVTAPDGDTAVVVTVWMPPFRDDMQMKAVKKTLTIPAWMNEAGEKAGVNFSQLLQSALRDALGIRQHPGA